LRVLVVVVGVINARPGSAACGCARETAET